MTPAIGTGSTAPTAQATQATQFDASVSARPQVQSRRVSLKLGPFGISYSTDRVLWTEAVAAAAAQTLGASEAKGTAATQGAVASVAGVDVAGRDGIDGRQAQAQQAEATSRAFSLELAQAWRRQVEERVRSDKTYGRDGSLKAKTTTGGGQTAGGGAANAATARGADQATRAAAQTDTAAQTDAAAQSGVAAASTASSSATGVFATRQEGAPASRMRQAIGAYLACARNVSAVPPMLTAVA